MSPFVPEIRVGYVPADELLTDGLATWKRDSVSSATDVLGLAFMANPPGDQWICIGTHISSSAVWAKEDIGRWAGFDNATWLGELELVGARLAEDGSCHDRPVWCDDVRARVTTTALPSAL